MLKTLLLWMCLLIGSGALVQAQDLLYPVHINGQWGFMDQTGQVVVKARYDQVGRYVKEDYAYVQRDQLLGAIDRNGREVLPCRYNHVNYLGQDLFVVTDAQGCRLIDKTGRVVMDSLSANLTLLSNGFISYETPQGLGVLHVRHGNLVQPQYHQVQVFSENWVMAFDRLGNCQLYDTLGRAMLPAPVKELTRDGELFWAKRGGKWGAYDLQGITRLEHQWKNYRYIQNGIYAVEDDLPNVALYIQRTRQLLPQRGQQPRAFETLGIEWVNEDEERCIIDSLGNTVLAIANCSEIKSLGQPGFFQYKRDNRYGVYQTGRGILTPPKYEMISTYSTEVAIIRWNGRWGVLNKAGEEIIRPQYEEPLTLSVNQVRYKSPQGAMQIFNFDETGQLLERRQFKNMRSLRIRGVRRQFTAVSGSDTAAFARSPYQINDTLRWVYHARAASWGLMNTKTGDYKYPPKWKTVQILRDQGLTIVKGEGPKVRSRVPMGRIDVFMMNEYGLFNNEHGVPITAMEFIDIRISDFEQGNEAARCIFRNGKHGLIATNGRIIAKNYTYIGEFADGIAPATRKGKLLADMSGKDKYPTLGTAATYLRAIMSRYREDTDNDPRLYRQLLSQATLYCEACQWGYLNTAADVVIPFQYDHAETHRYQYARVRNKGKWGMIDLEGSTSLPIANDTLNFLPNSDEQLYLVKRYRPLYGIMDSIGQIVVPVVYSQVGTYQEERLAVQDTLGKWGFLDRAGQSVVACAHQKVRAFREGMAAYRSHYRWGYYDHAGRAITKAEYIRCGDFSEGKAWVQMAGNRWGYLNTRGEVLFDGRYSILTDFHQGRAAVKISRKGWGIVDETGAYILAPSKRYKKILPFNQHGLAFVKVGKKYRLINREGEWVGKRRYGTVRPYSEGIAIVRYQRLQGFHIGKRNRKWALIDTAGEAVTKEQFRYVRSFVEGRACFKGDEGGYGYLDRQGGVAVAPQYLKATDFKDNRAVVFQRYDQSGVIDTSGKVILEIAYNRIEDHQHGRALVRRMGKGYQYYNENGEQANTGLYAKAQPYYRQAALVKIGHYWGLVNDKGLTLRLPQFDGAGSFQGGTASVAVVHHYGITDRGGKVLLEPVYDYIAYMGNGLFRVEQAGKVGYINREGTWVWALQ